MPAFEWVHVQLHQQKGMISLSPPTICNSAGYAVLAIPAVIWAKSVLNLLHKLPVLAAAFWILVAVFAWQAALVGILFYGVLATPKAPANTNGKKSRKANLMGTYSYDFKTGECFS
ncbi:hypothetical protein EK73_003588 [Escherichia coli]|nr:hypothetical protein [Escherichia coli]